MKTSHSHQDRFQAVLSTTTSPTVKAALERTAVYLQQTNGRFVAQLTRAKQLPHIEGSGVLAGPIKRPAVSGKKVKVLQTVTFKAAKLAKKK